MFDTKTKKQREVGIGRRWRERTSQIFQERELNRPQATRRNYWSALMGDISALMTVLTLVRNLALIQDTATSARCGCTTITEDACVAPSNPLNIHVLSQTYVYGYITAVKGSRRKCTIRVACKGIRQHRQLAAVVSLAHSSTGQSPVHQQTNGDTHLHMFFLGTGY